MARQTLEQLTPGHLSCTTSAGAIKHYQQMQAVSGLWTYELRRSCEYLIALRARALQNFLNAGVEYARYVRLAIRRRPVRRVDPDSGLCGLWDALMVLVTQLRDRIALHTGFFGDVCPLRDKVPPLQGNSNALRLSWAGRESRQRAGVGSP